MGDFRRRLMMSAFGGEGDPDLPQGAIPCEQIFTDGYSVFIDSGLVAMRSMSIDTDLQVVKAPNTGHYPFGYYISSVRYTPIAFDSSGHLQAGYGNYYSYTSTSFSTRYQPMRHFRVVMTDTGHSAVVTEDGSTFLEESIEYDETSRVFSDTNTLSILGRKTSNSAIETGSWRGGIGKTKIYSDDHFGTLVADYIPCYYNGNFGLWDKVSETHLTGTTQNGVYGYGKHWGTSGFSPNVRVHTSHGYIYDNRWCSLSPLIAIPQGCTQIMIHLASEVNSDMTVGFYKSTGAYVSYYTYNSVDRVLTVPSTAFYIRATFYTQNLDSGFLYDVTNDKYIWKGINV